MSNPLLIDAALDERLTAIFGPRLTAKPPPQKPDPAETWKPTETPGIEINGNGHRRTKDHKPQTAEKPWPKKPEPAVTEGNVYDWADYGC